MKTYAGIAAILAAVGSTALAAIEFPADAGVINVAAFGAIPNDGIDDTAAIQAALDAHPSGNHIFYFADGVYDISNTLAPARDDGVTKRNIFQGQSQSGVVLKLADNLGFTGAVIDYNQNATQNAAQFFRNSVRNLTIDTGVGNQATGLRFNASNQGTVRDVTVRSGDGAGSYGIITGAAEPGPLLIQNVTINGFDVGLQTQLPTASQTVEGLTLNNQNTAGWVNTLTQNVYGRKVVSNNSVRAISNVSEANMVLLDSTFTGTGAAASTQAILNQKAMFVRDVATTGYADAVANNLAAGRGNARNGQDYIHEWWANGAYGNRRGGMVELFESPDTTLRLPVREHPTRAYPPVADWAGPQNFLVETSPGVFAGIPDDGIDDTPAIQAAINSGAKVVYLPRGTWQIDGVVQIGNNVERFMGTEARIEGNGSLRVTDGTSDTVFIERLEDVPTIQHNSSRTLVLEHLLDFEYQVLSATPGDVFLNDVTGRSVAFTAGQNVWARQLNLEGDVDANNPALPDAKLINNGANVWVLGMKVEDRGTLVRTVNGGMTELFGAVKIGSGFTAGIENAMFVTEDASLVAVLPKLGPSAPGYDFVAKEVRDGQTLTATTFGQADGYAAFNAEAIRHREVVMDNADPTGVSIHGNWTVLADAFPGGYLDQDLLYTSPGAGKRITYTPDLPRDGLYEVFIRWIDDRSGQPHSGHASVVPVHLLTDRGLIELEVNMAGTGGYWYSLGLFDLEPDELSSLSILAEGANGTVIADAVRFLFRFAEGDANMDGSVNFADFNIILGNFGTASGAEWVDGDFNGDGAVDFADFNIVLGNFGLTPVAADVGVTPADWARLAAVIPEPGSLMLAGPMLGALWRHPRR
ncbi:MAG: glycosyl hydrolase family 28-related protein [Phycisphaerae bacterium]